jgi:hypothetical protein
MYKIIIASLIFFTSTTIVSAQAKTDSTITKAKVYSSWGYKKIYLVEQGKANLYEYSKTYYNTQGTSSITRYYFNVGDGSLQKAKIKYLKPALKDSPQATKYLKNLTTYQRVTGSVGIAGLLIGGLGTISYLSNNNEDSSVNNAMILGFGMALVANLTIIIGPKPKKAIYIYNKY